jgi:hypothetical protein
MFCNKMVAIFHFLIKLCARAHVLLSSTRNLKTILWTPLSETAFRRSSRIKNKNKGFKQTVCSSKSCLACSAHPPGLSNKALKAIGRSICKIPEEKLSDSALKNKPKSFKTIGEKGASVKPPKGRKTKKTPKLTKKTDDDEEEDKEDLQD